MSDNSKDESTINANELDGESHDEEQSQNQYESDVEKHFKSGMLVNTKLLFRLFKLILLLLWYNSLILQSLLYYPKQIWMIACLEITVKGMKTKS